MVDRLPTKVVGDKTRVAHVVWYENRQHLWVMTRRTGGTKGTVVKKDRREQNRINQQSFRERKRKEFEDLRAELDSIKASQVRTSGERSPGTSLGASTRDDAAQHNIPSNASRFETPAESKIERTAVPRNEISSDTSLDPSLLELPSSMEFGSSHAPHLPDMLDSIDWGVECGGQPSTSADLGCTDVSRYDLGSTLQDRNSTFGRAPDGMQPATHDMSSNTLHAPTLPFPVDPLASITADYMNAQLLALKSAEWYARAAEVGIKIATTRQNAWLDKSMLWPQWSLENVSGGQSFSGHEGLVGLDYMSTDTLAQTSPPQPTNLPDPWYPMLPQDWQQSSADMRGVAA